MRGFAETQARRLLRVLLLRVSQMSADPATEILLLRIAKNKGYLVSCPKNPGFRDTGLS